mmetsp:Transcript_16561/g.25875  ORF Transcript_16561/g.25875 Transcript_16561/m.25875 type:complete len:552 (-) Transcript_16561:189-1844(-)|eukprot:CAMPEP_0196804834 /NCGR_PEP_ID=MMETSP1362-20130617/4510_1 /TAXON_ID=163516 /ORGANISM="Leptocylindrus danicus, Strain CCMP1856" /LENGTH=551 /DNA_ID=CAMNT_0042177363 /DNA_START=118 /DNA_END=1773 /DNA_ORIENTATION=+
MDVSATNSGYDKYERFEHWLRENGSQIDMVELREYDTAPGNNASKSSTSAQVQIGNEEEDKKEENPEVEQLEQVEEECEMRGVHVKQSIPPNTTVIVIPKQCLITVEMGQATEIGQAILSSELDLDAPKHVFLMIFLLMDRRDPESFFKYYYATLPKTLHNMPVFWNEEDLKYLEGSYLLQQIQDRNDAIREDYEAICNVAPVLSEIATLDEFKWARMCVCSRNFGLLINGVRTSALVPHADMLNHYRPRETKWTFDNERQAFTITTLQTIQGGAEIYDSYGQKCNHRFLLNYGFAIENNTELDGYCPNEVPLELSPLLLNELLEARGETISSKPVTGALDIAKSEFWCRDTPAATALTVGALSIVSGDTKTYSNLCASSSYVKRIRVSVSNNENTKAMMSMLRVIVADEDELSAITCGGLYMYRTCKDVRFAISIKNERAALQLLSHVVEKALAQYPTTLDEDNVMLSSPDLLPAFSNARHATIQVRGEKEVLHHYKKLAETALTVIELDDTEFENAIKTMQDSTHYTIVHYCADVIGSILRENKRAAGI